MTEQEVPTPDEETPDVTDVVAPGADEGPATDDDGSTVEPEAES